MAERPTLSPAPRVEPARLADEQAVARTTRHRHHAQAGRDVLRQLGALLLLLISSRRLGSAEKRTTRAADGPHLALSREYAAHVVARRHRAHREPLEPQHCRGQRHRLARELAVPKMRGVVVEVIGIATPGEDPASTAEAERQGVRAARGEGGCHRCCGALDPP